MDNLLYLPLLLLSLILIFKPFFHNTKLPPGPLPLPLIGHLHLLRKPLHRTLTRLSNQYGPVLFLRFGSRPVVVVSSPAAVEECFTKNDVIFASRPRLLAGKHLGYNFTTLVWAPYGDHWRNLRRVTTLEVFSSKCIAMFSGVRAEEVRRLCRQLSRESRHEVEMKSMFFNLVMNIMSRITAGKRYYGDEKDAVGAEEAEKFQEIVDETFLLSGASNLADYLPFLGVMDSLGLEKRLKKLQGKRDALWQGLIDERRRSGKDSIHFSVEEMRKKTLIDVLLSLQESDPEYYTDEIVKGIILIMFTAATDTTSVTLEWAMSLLLNHPEVMKKARAEIDTRAGHTRLMDETDLQYLPYLHNIIKETLRLYPVTPLLVPHESSERCTIGGFEVPPSTMLLVNLSAIQKDPSVWPEPSRFMPERFEAGALEREGFKMLPFGVGRRSCPGENLAMKAMCMALGTLIQCFEWTRIGDEEVDMREGMGLTMPMAEPLVAICTPRSMMSDLLSQEGTT